MRRFSVLRLSRTAATAGAGLTVALLLAVSAPAQTAAKADGGTPSSGVAADGSSLARYIPRDNLMIYAELNGLDAHADAWKKTAAYKILNDTSTGAMLEDLATQLLEKTPWIGPEKKMTGADAVAVLKHIARNGFVLGAHGKPNAAGDGADQFGVLALRGAARKDVRPLFGKLLGTLLQPGDKSQPVTRGKRKIVNVTASDSQRNWSWWIETDVDLVMVFGQSNSADHVFEVLDKHKPNAVDHPQRTELAKPEGEFQPLLTAFVDIEHLLAFKPKTPTPSESLKSMGLEGLKRIDYRLGFEGPALVSMTRVVAPSPRSGWLALLDNPATFDVKSLPPVPAALEGFSVVSSELLTRAVDRARAMLPDMATAAYDKFAESFKKATRLRFQEDFLAMIGPRVAFYTLPPKTASIPVASVTGAGFQVPKLVLMADVKDSVAFGKALDEGILLLNKALERPAAEKAAEAAGVATRRTKGASGRGGITGPRFKMTSPNPKTYVLSLPPAQAAFTNLNLTIALGKKYLVVSTASDVAKQALALEAKPSGRWTPAADLAASLATLPKRLMFLQVDDAAKTTSESLANLPASVQALGSMIAAANNPAAALAAAAAAAPGGGPAANQPGGGRMRGGRAGIAAGGGGRRGPVGVAPPGSEGSGAAPGASALAGAGAPAAASAAPGAAGAAAGSFDIRIDASKAPAADAVKPLLFPGTAAMTVDAQGLTLVTRESFPDLLGGLTPSSGAALAQYLPGIMQYGQEYAKAKAEGRPPPALASIFVPPGGIPSAASAPGAKPPPAGAGNSPGGRTSAPD